MSWYIIGISGQPIKVVEGASREEINKKYKTDPLYGPFKTKEDADKFAKDHQLNGIFGGSLGGSQSNVIGDIGKITGIQQIGAAFESFYRILTDGKMWRSLGWIILGLIFIISGIFLWLKNSNILPTSLPIPEG